MSKKIVLLASLLFIFFASDAFATIVNFGNYDLGPSDPLVIEGVTITPLIVGKGRPATVGGMGLGSDWIGSPGRLDRFSHYGAGQNGGYTTQKEGINLKVDGVLNSFTISPYFSVLEGYDMQFPIELTYLGGGYNGGFREHLWDAIDPAVSTYTYDLRWQSGLKMEPVDNTYILLASYWDEMMWAWEDLYLNGYPEVSFQYGFTITSVDYTPVQSVPEPGTLILVFSGLIGCAAFRRRVEIRR
ncbi:MAG: PEP-CTERM sorting domain-containing protein [Desulfobacterales bacterium]|nr:PEP-CTERM sorting domain-containing protein [Desulfobacterales bacterium]